MFRVGAIRLRKIRHDVPQIPTFVSASWHVVRMCGGYRWVTMGSGTIDLTSNYRIFCAELINYLINERFRTKDPVDLIFLAHLLPVKLLGRWGDHCTTLATASR